MATKRKTRDRWDIEVNYGYGDGWECEFSEYEKGKAWKMYKCYTENIGGEYAVRMTKHREKLADLPKEPEPLEDALERLGWNFRWGDDGRSIDIQQFSPAGEDLNFEIEADEDESIEHAIFVFAEEFDVDEHIDFWAEYRGTRGVPETYRELVHDAEAIKAMLNELADAILPQR